ncbi:alpha-amylase family member [Anaeramoeba flamelloides]|uniref:Alpha-amylase family member n=1 Tax=Anaeramoeba flamelloides TaxID=1746091 RepID=A0AAV8A925_9EUKA|nr:alpha-amylase family member [Anaeramoeba flamelloides]|eukprot:Anaeramoba_flamelloidesa325303_178.p1 GENE.a325303_178~~a325303_178.p1  ORF type:complete len:745 (-),score=174.81 a325303_178:75-2309(-)
MDEQTKKWVGWMKKRSMLYQAKQLCRSLQGKTQMYQKKFGESRYRMATEQYPVWFNAYPESMITGDMSLLDFFGTEELWEQFESLGISTVHHGPVNESGGLSNQYTRTASVDGYFDQISYNISPNFLTTPKTKSQLDENEIGEVSIEKYQKMVKTAFGHKGVIAGDIIPGHSARGYDFYLALLNYKSYPGIYTLIEVPKDHYGLLPDVPSTWETTNLSPNSVKELTKLKVIPGKLERVMFSDPSRDESLPKETGWDATGPIKGVDGITRRWVYLHYFKPGQPTYNWLDCTGSSQLILFGDIIKSVSVYGAKFLRLDANPFLGIEPKLHLNKKEENEKEKENENEKEEDITCWSENHPLSLLITSKLSMLSHKFDAFTFQELNHSFETIKSYGEFATDLSYDFISRPALQHSILSGDCTFLYLMMKCMLIEYKINPISLIHGMQNHDEITYELVHLMTHAKDKFQYGSQEVTGEELRNNIRNEVKTLVDPLKLLSNASLFSGNGLCTTFVGLLSAALKLDTQEKVIQNKELICRGHLALLLFNAMMPGVVQISGWDLVGSLPLNLNEIRKQPQFENFVKEKIDSDSDWRWLNRPTFDLLGLAKDDKKVNSSPFGLPRTFALYGDLKCQSSEKNSFMNRVKDILQVRKEAKIHLGTFDHLIEFNEKPHVFGIIYNTLPKTKVLVLINFQSPLSNPDSINVPLPESASDVKIITSNLLENPQIAIKDNNLAIELHPWAAIALSLKEN